MKTLESLSTQTCKKFKVFIGNDNSPDDPIPLINQFDQFLDIHYKKFESNFGRKSLVSHWERCIINAPVSKWIMILGDDDTLSRNCIESFYANLIYLQNNNINVFKFSTQIINEVGEPLSVKFNNCKINDSKDFLRNRIEGGLRSSLSENIFRRSVVNKVGLKDFPLAWHSDDLAVFEFSLNGSSKIFYSNEAMVSIRISDLRISGNQNIKSLKNRASYLFYKYLISNYLLYFNRDFELLLFKKLEKTILNNRSNCVLFLDLAIFYLRQARIRKFLNFLIKYFYSFKI